MGLTWKTGPEGEWAVEDLTYSGTAGVTVIFEVESAAMCCYRRVQDRRRIRLSIDLAVLCPPTPPMHLSPTTFVCKRYSAASRGQPPALRQGTRRLGKY